ncbi:hypothetical protein BT96DRAFT_913093 [Gymnopus androsaceus JB14]|uniref:Uncharacterized protein n=1 Tax=Gymnopus androsaceus JB14 TaxID=1447944 RepID=A0A6A4IKU3_9AGAR|nr:hypothetical protein BT96DRAFT_913093 [Gymnopus androsaceus JB14]
MKLNPCFILLGLAAATYSMPIDTIEVRDVGEKWNSATEWVKDHGPSYVKAFYNAGKTAVNEQESSGGFLHPTVTRRSALAPLTTSSPLPTSTLAPSSRALLSVPKARAFPTPTARAFPPSFARREANTDAVEPNTAVESAVYKGTEKVENAKEKVKSAASAVASSEPVQDEKNGLSLVAQGFKQSANDTKNAVEAPFKAAATSLQSKVAAVTSSIKEPIKSMATGLAAAASGAKEGYASAQTSSDLPPTLTARSFTIPTARAFPPSFARREVNNDTEGGSSSGEEVQNGLKEIGKGVGEAGTNAASALTAPLKAKVTSEENKVAAVTSSIKEPFKAVATGAAAAASGAKKGYEDAQTPTPTARDFPASVVQRDINAAASALGNGVANVKNSEPAQNIGGGAKQLWTGVKGGTVSVGHDIANSVNKGTHWVGEKVNGVVNEAKGAKEAFVNGASGASQQQ